MYSFNSKDQAYDYVDCHFVICQKCFWTTTIFGIAKKRGQYSFECYDITDPDHPSELSIWDRGTREACTVLYYLSKNKTILEVIRNGQPRSKTTTYQINPPLD